MKHPVFFVEVWKRNGGGLVIRSEETDSAERAKRMALELRTVDVWYVSVIVKHPDGVAVIGEHALESMRTEWAGEESQA
jgi:hypothetical protein